MSDLNGVLWSLALVGLVGTLVASVFLSWYRRWIAGIPVTCALPLLLSLAQIAHLSERHALSAILMMLGLVSAFAGIHLIWFGRQSRLVFKKPVGKV